MEIHGSQPGRRVSLFDTFKSQEAASDNGDNPSIQVSKACKWWMQLCVYTFFVLFGQSGATLLRRLYYEKGGKSIWLASLLETVGFPILIPFSFNFSRSCKDHHDSINGEESPKKNNPSSMTLLTSYLCLGLLQAINNLLYSVGLLYLPVSTFSLLSASELFFTAFFSIFINKQKLTPPIVNSLVLLIVSSTILIIHGDSERRPSGISRRNYAVGFSSTIIASAVYSLQLSLTQLFFQKVSGPVTFTTVLNILFYQSLVASCFGAVAVVVSGDGRGLRREMETFELGKVTYWLVLVGIVAAWQAFAVGAVGLIFRVSSLFSNIIGALALPIIPILAAVFFHEQMDALKVITMLLALWGVVSYVYQHYLDDCKQRDSF